MPMGDNAEESEESRGRGNLGRGQKGGKWRESGKETRGKKRGNKEETETFCPDAWRATFRTTTLVSRSAGALPKISSRIPEYKGPAGSTEPIKFLDVLSRSPMRQALEMHRSTFNEAFPPPVFFACCQAKNAMALSAGTTWFLGPF